VPIPHFILLNGKMLIMMNRISNLRYFLFVIFSLFLFNSCKNKGESYISLRNLTNHTMINIHNAYLRAKAMPDSVVYAGIHYAEILGDIYDISDSLNIRYFGHCWSLSNPNPILTNSPHTLIDINSDSVDIDPNATEFQYISKLYGLELDTPYFVRSYVIFTDPNGNIIDTAYNPNVKVFRTKIPQDVWFKKADFDGLARSEAVAFILDGEIYVGLGYNGYSLLNDFWVYNPDGKYWKNIKNFYSARRSAVATVYNDTAIVGTGYTNVNGPERDMYRYEKSANLWIRIDSLPGNCERYDAVAFTLNINGKERAIVGTGYRNAPLNDFYVYKSELDTAGAPLSAWRQLPSFQGAARSQAVAAVIDNKAIVGLGVGNSNTYLKDFYLYDPNEGTQGAWRYLTVAPDEVSGRANAVAFTLSYTRNGALHNMFYFGTGRDENDSLYNDLWAYDLNQGKWYKKSNIREDFLIGDPREGAVAVSFKRSHVDYGTLVRGLVGLGKSKNGVKRDFWEYLP